MDGKIELQPVEEKDNKVIVEGVKDFCLEHIFDCGQCFRWEAQRDGSYTGLAFGKVVNMQFVADSENGGRLIIDNCTAEDFEGIWRPYLDLDRDYGQIKEELRKGDNVIEDAMEYGSGIRILKQDLWETMVSFIISQNNNIPRIKGCIESLCRLLGTAAAPYGGREYYNIPAAEALAPLAATDLAPCKLGYRARYLVETARQVTEAGGPDQVALRLAESQDPAAELTRFCGVGPKVANCIALFGLGHYDAFPIDVWVRRVMNQLYGIDEKDTKTMAAYAKEHFGSYGGFAQQYLFYYIRSLQQ